MKDEQEKFLFEFKKSTIVDHLEPHGDKVNLWVELSPGEEYARSRQFLLYLENVKHYQQSVKPRLVRVAPGTYVARLLKFALAQKQYERIYEPQIADMQREYCDALLAKEPAKAWWIRIRFGFGLLKTALLSLPIGLLRMLWEAIKTT